MRTVTWQKDKCTLVFIIIAVLFAAVNLLLWERLSLVRRLVTVFAALAAAHELEEKLWPGGFFDLMLGKLGLRTEEVDLSRGTAAVGAYWLLLLALPYIFHGQVWLLAMTIALSFFEAFIHTAGIAIHHLKKPYTPGMVTAWLLAAFTVVAVTRLNAGGLIGPGGYAVGALLMVGSFLCLDGVILLSLGDKRQVILRTIRSRMGR